MLSNIDDLRERDIVLGTKLNILSEQVSVLLESVKTLTGALQARFDHHIVFEEIPAPTITDDLDSLIKDNTQ